MSSCDSLPRRIGMAITERAVDDLRGERHYAEVASEKTYRGKLSSIELAMLIGMGGEDAATKLASGRDQLLEARTLLHQELYDPLLSRDDVKREYVRGCEASS